MDDKHIDDLCTYMGDIAIQLHAQIEADEPGYVLMRRRLDNSPEGKLERQFRDLIVDNLRAAGFHFLHFEGPCSGIAPRDPKRDTMLVEWKGSAPKAGGGLAAKLHAKYALDEFRSRIDPDCIRGTLHAQERLPGFKDAFTGLMLTKGWESGRAEITIAPGKAIKISAQRRPVTWERESDTPLPHGDLWAAEEMRRLIKRWLGHEGFSFKTDQPIGDYSLAVTWID